jgi:hypothetical protein
VKESWEKLGQDPQAKLGNDLSYGSPRPLDCPEEQGSYIAKIHKSKEIILCRSWPGRRLKFQI